MRPRRRDTTGNLDSLLDTMTNVVGILVILLTVTQLGVADAVKRMIGAQQGVDAASDVTQQQIAEAAEELDRLEARDEALKQQREQALAAAPHAEAELEALRPQLAALEQAVSAKSIAAQTAAMRSAVTEQQKQAALLEQRIAAAEAELTQLRTALSSTPKPQPPPPKVVTLPDPRPAPPGLEPVTFMCRDGRIAAVPLEGLQRLAQGRLKQVIDDANEKGHVDCERMAAVFEQREVGNATFRLGIEVVNYRPYLLITKREQAGETAEALRQSTSGYKVQVYRTDPASHYVRYLVWPDSFEVYLEARRIADERGIAAGWVPFYEEQEWRADLGVTLTCQGKPDPKPVEPRPAPPPEPAPKPVERRELPQDTID